MKKTRSPQKVVKNLLNLREEYARSTLYVANWGESEFIKKIDECLYGEYNIIRNEEKQK